MSLISILSISISIRIIALILSIALVQRLRDWRMGFLALMLGLMGLRQSLTLFQALQTPRAEIADPLTELPGLVVSILALLAVVFLERMLIQLRKHGAHLEELVEDRTDELRRRNRELATLLETSLKVALATDLEVVLDYVAEAARTVVAADNAYIATYDERQDRFTVSASAGLDNILVKGHQLPARPEGITRRMLREREPVLAADVRDDPVVNPLERAAGVRSLIGMPIDRQQRLLGVLYVSARAPGAFDERHLTVLRLCGSEAAAAIENDRLLQRQQIEARRLRTLNELMVGIVGPRALDQTLDSIAQAIVDLLGCDMAAVALLDPASDEIRIPVGYGHRGYDRSFVEQFGLSAGSGAGGTAFDEGRVLVIPDTEAEGVVIDRAQAERAGIRAMLVGPLQTPESKLGVLYANQRHPYAFREDEVAFFSVLAGQAAVSIENARLYEQLQAHSRDLTASLEQLNRQYRRQTALAEIELAINKPHELQTVLDRIAEATTEHLPASAGASIVLWDSQMETFFVSATTVPGLTPQTFSSQTRSRGGVTRWIVDQRQPFVVPDVREDPFAAGWVMPDYSARAYAGFPLLAEDNSLGVLFAFDRRPREYTQEDLDFLTTLASRSAVAITNVRLYEQAQTLATLEERQRLAHDLHDVVSQTLFSASLIAETLPRLWERDPGQVRRGLSELQSLTRGALAELRGLLLELRPSALAEIGLSDLLRQLTAALTGHSQTDVSLTVEGQQLLPPDVRIAFYRIAQESLNNIVKHSRAKRVVVSLTPAPFEIEGAQREGVVMHIHDDGRGFDPQRISPGHMGLGIMRERAEAVGATLTVNSQPDRGTDVVVTWPKRT